MLTQTNFDVNERFKFLESYVDMVASGAMRSAIVVGSGGLGKSFTVFNQLTKSGYNVKSEATQQKPIPAIFSGLDVSKIRESIGNIPVKNYLPIKGFSTSKGLYRTLYENRNSLIVFDDCDSILEDKVSINLLKAALDSYDERIVTWNSEVKGLTDLPKSFDFRGGVIFISNLPMNKIPQAIISRSVTADVSMTVDETIIRMRQIVTQGKFMHDVPMNFKIEALDFIGECVSQKLVKMVNMRTLISVITNRRCMETTWKRLSLSMMVSALN